MLDPAESGRFVGDAEAKLEAAAFPLRAEGASPEDILHELGPQFFVPSTAAADPRLLRKLDVMWAAELYDRALNGAPVEALQAQREDLVKFVQATNDIPMIKVFGSARDHVWCPQLEAFTNELARLAVQQNVSLGNGAGSTGAMGKTIHAWEAERARQPDSQAQIVLVPLAFHQETFEKPVEGVDAIIGPSSSALQLRTSLLHMMGVGLGNVYYPGGFGSGEELAVDMVGRQLARPIDTIHSHRGSLGKVWLLSPTMGEQPSSGFWDKQLEQYQQFAAAGAINPAELGALTILTLENPEQDALRVLEHGIGCLDGVSCRFP
jgi:hypothetical protein